MNKMKTITLILVMILSLTMPLVSFAEETAENDVMPINETETTTEDATENAQNPITEDTFKKSDVYLVGDEITIDYIVDGNLFVLADKVTINSQIGGDAFICANSITLSEQSYIFSNLFAVSQNIDIKGVVYDLYSISKNVTISGYIYRDARTTSETINIFGTVGRNAFIDCNSLNFAEPATEEGATTKNGIINGNLEYSANNEIEIPEGSVSGETIFTQKTVNTTNTIQDHLLSLGSITVTALLVWLVCLWLAPKFLANTSNLVKKPLKVIGLGILSPIALIVASVILIVLGITSTFGLFILSITFIFIGLGTSFFIILVNNLICNKLNITKNIKVFGMLVATSIVLWLIGLIPYVGTVIGLIGVIIGIGVITSSILPRKKLVENKE